MIEQLIAKAVADAQRPLLERVEQLLTSARPAAAADTFLTIAEVAALTQYDRKTVMKWIGEGKLGTRGKRVYLPALQFAPGEYRVQRAALDAFGQGIGADKPTISAKPAKAAKPAAATQTSTSPSGSLQRAA